MNDEQTEKLAQQILEVLTSEAMSHAEQQDILLSTLQALIIVDTLDCDDPELHKMSLCEKMIMRAEERLESYMSMARETVRGLV